MMKHLRNRIAGMVEIVSAIVMSADGSVTSEASSEDDKLDSSTAWHFGFYSRPKDGARGLVLKADGRGNTSFLIGYRDTQYELTLEKGEVAIASAFDAKILLDKNGAIAATSKSGQKITLNGSDYSLLKTETLLTDLSTLMTHLIAWVPLVVTAVATAPVGAAVDPGVATTATAIKAAITGGNYKSSKVSNG